MRTRRRKSPKTDTRIQARCRLLSDKKQYFLGENILVHFRLVNTGRRVFTVDYGGDYEGGTRYARFIVTATSADGSQVSDPRPEDSDLDIRGGIGSEQRVEPGEAFSQSLSLPRYCRFERPGTYRIRIKHDLGWLGKKDRVIPVGEITLRLVMPTPKQARKVVEQMDCLPGGGDCMGTVETPWADFSALAYPVYLPILTERAQNGDFKALAGIGKIDTPTATEILIQLLGHVDRKFALAAADALGDRLPDWELRGELPSSSNSLPDDEDPRSRMARLSWTPELGIAARAAARKLLEMDDLPLVIAGALILESIGVHEDVPTLLRTLDREIVQCTREAREGLEFPPSHETTEALLRAAEVLLKCGIEVPAEPRTPAEVALFLTGLRVLPGFRPIGWAEQCVTLSTHPIPFIRQLVLRSVPQLGLPPEIRGRLRATLEDTSLRLWH